jgi:hypothetical protein
VRDKTKWRMREAITILNEQLVKMVNSEFVSSLVI